MSGVKTYASPTGLFFGQEAALAVQNWQAQWFVENLIAYSHVQVTHKSGGAYTDEILPADDAPVLLKPAPLPFAATPPVIMGVLNVTPDSFSDGGQFFSFEKAVERALHLINGGAAILDIGGESTRPSATPLSPEEEQKRVLPVIKEIAPEAKKRGVFISIDTRNASTMEAAIKAGASIINDVTALTHDPRAMKAAAESKLPVVLMHMQGTPETMQKNPTYARVECDIYDYFEERIAACEEAGISKANIIVDPGIGFGKTPAHSAVLLRRASVFHQLSVPLMIGASRKSFIGALAGIDKAQDRLPGSLVAARVAIGQSVQIIRAHDVAETKQAVDFWQALQAATP